MTKTERKLLEKGRRLMLEAQKCLEKVRDLPGAELATVHYSAGVCRRYGDKIEEILRGRG